MSHTAFSGIHLFEREHSSHRLWVDLCISHGLHGLQGGSCFTTVLTRACRRILTLVLGAPPLPFSTDLGATMLFSLTCPHFLLWLEEKLLPLLLPRSSPNSNILAGSHSTEKLIWSRFHAGQTVTVFLLSAPRSLEQAVPGLFNASRQVGLGRRGHCHPCPSATPALLPVAWLAGCGQVGKAHCRLYWDGSSCSTLHTVLGWSWWWCLATPGKKPVCAVLIFVLNRSSQRHFHLSNWASSISIFRAIRDWLCWTWWMLLAASDRNHFCGPPTLPENQSVPNQPCCQVQQGLHVHWSRGFLHSCGFKGFQQQCWLAEPRQLEVLHKYVSS